MTTFITFAMAKVFLVVLPCRLGCRELGRPHCGWSKYFPSIWQREITIARNEHYKVPVARLMLRDFRLSVRPGAATTHNSSPSRSRHIRFNTQSIPSSEESRDYMIVILLQREKS
jgi:hypothetical protein